MYRILMLALVVLTMAAAGCGGDRQAGEAALEVPAAGETGVVAALGDSADDAEIWVHPADPAKSVILATSKKDGLVVFGLDGRELQRVPVGPLNNVDLRAWPDWPIGVAVATNRGNDSVSVFAIDPTGGLVSHIGDAPTGKSEPYGICMAVESGKPLVAVTYKDGAMQMCELALEDTAPGLTHCDWVEFGGQVEGCVFDESVGFVFVGEEDRGLWVLDYREPRGAPRLVDAVGSQAGLVADVEGVALWRGAEGTGWLIVSAQAASSFMVYERAPPHQFRGSFKVSGSVSGLIDPVTHTDGVAVTSASLPGFPRGLLVVQDHGNPEPLRFQNFKLVDWRYVETQLDLPFYELDK